MLRLDRSAMAMVVSALLAATSANARAQDVPEKYVVDYPIAERFCPPIWAYFQEVQQTVGRVGSRTFRHQPNGGYGLAL